MPGMTAPGSTALRSTSGSSPEVPAAQPDWPAQATDTIIKTVDSVRDKTTGPALNVARWLTYGLVLAFLVGPLAVLAFIGVLRLCEGGLLWLQSSRDLPYLHDPIWIVYLVFGLIFTVAGLIAWRKGRRPSPAH